MLDWYKIWYIFQRTHFKDFLSPSHFFLLLLSTSREYIYELSSYRDTKSFLKYTHFYTCLCRVDSLSSDSIVIIMHTAIAMNMLTRFYALLIFDKKSWWMHKILSVAICETMIMCRHIRA